MKYVRSHWFVFLLLLTVLIVIIAEIIFHAVQRKRVNDQKDKLTTLIPDYHTLSNSAFDQQILYGRELVINTSLYFGPNGSLHKANGLNCQDCHQEAGTKPYGNNFLGVAATYPKFRERSGGVETINRRLSDCFKRSLASTEADTSSAELKAISAYIMWTGKNIPGNLHIEGTGAKEIDYINRAADSASGQTIYITRCKSCHGSNGEGQPSDNPKRFRYPPLWGAKSYAVSAGMYRLSKLAAYVRNNMPPGGSFQHPQLINEEAWDVAAYINSQPHPMIQFAGDWPVLSTKPVDYPFGPYADNFSETQHKYGPFKPILDQRHR